jgi:hypothetical protein
MSSVPVRQSLDVCTRQSSLLAYIRTLSGLTIHTHGVTRTMPTGSSQLSTLTTRISALDVNSLLRLASHRNILGINGSFNSVPMFVIDKANTILVVHSLVLSLCVQHPLRTTPPMVDVPLHNSRRDSEPRTYIGPSQHPGV